MVYKFKYINLQIILSGDECTIEPISGILEPKSFIELKLALICSYDPSVYEGELECTISWEADKQMKRLSV